MTGFAIREVFDRIVVPTKSAFRDTVATTYPNPSLGSMGPLTLNPRKLATGLFL